MTAIYNIFETELKKEFNVFSVSKSVTDFGKSWYFRLNENLNNPLKIRLSDHEVGDRRNFKDNIFSYINANSMKTDADIIEVVRVLKNIWDDKIIKDEYRKNAENMVSIKNVRHAKYGVGQVKWENNSRIGVVFENGYKELIVKFANLETL